MSSAIVVWTAFEVKAKYFDNRLLAYILLVQREMEFCYCWCDRSVVMNAQASRSRNIFTNLAKKLRFAVLRFDLQLRKRQICHTKSSPHSCFNQLLNCQLYGGCLVGVCDVVEWAEVSHTLLKVKRDEHRVDIRAKGHKIPPEHEAILKFTNAAEVHFEVRTTLHCWLPARLRVPTVSGRPYIPGEKHTIRCGTNELCNNEWVTAMEAWRRKYTPFDPSEGRKRANKTRRSR